MKHFRIKTIEEIEFGDDIERIGRILRERGYHSTSDQCSQLWRLYSDDVCASWLRLPKEDNDIFECVQRYMIDE